MREWLVGGAVIEGPEGVLLVENLRRGGARDWSTPGGVIDEGETMLGGLTREVREETGLEVVDWDGPLYEIDVVAEGLGWHLQVEVHRAVRHVGEIRIDDPDGIVVGSRWVGPEACASLLDGGHPWVVEPLAEWLEERWMGSRPYRYVVDGADRTDLRVTRR